MDVKPVIAFLTDFGTRDHYVGAMKGVALGICPDAVLVDLTHDIDPQDIASGALELAAAYRYFPHGTVFVAVVDPGVGSARLGIAADAGGFRFVGPDNGVLSLVFRETPPARLVSLREAKYARPAISRTFEGRDRFAPAAAWLARGIDLDALGPRLAAWQTLSIAEAHVDGGRLVGEVLRVDRFGNLITNVGRDMFDRFSEGVPVTVAAGGHTIQGVVQTYADAAAGAVCALFGSSERLEIAVQGGSAVRALGLYAGSAVTITRQAEEA